MQLRKLWLAVSCLFFACPATFAASPPDLRKSIIEVPLKRTIRTSAPSPAMEERVVSVSADGTQKCVPGKVRWAKDFEQAKALAKRSGRPVLLFAMLGNLDEKFC